MCLRWMVLDPRTLWIHGTPTMMTSMLANIKVRKRIETVGIPLTCHETTQQILPSNLVSTHIIKYYEILSTIIKIHQNIPKNNF